jgi:hypothetical protein
MLAQLQVWEPLLTTPATATAPPAAAAAADATDDADTDAAAVLEERCAPLPADKEPDAQLSLFAVTALFRIVTHAQLAAPLAVEVLQHNSRYRRALLRCAQLVSTVSLCHDANQCSQCCSSAGSSVDLSSSDAISAASASADDDIVDAHQ